MGVDKMTDLKKMALVRDAYHMYKKVGWRAQFEVYKQRVESKSNEVTKKLIAYLLQKYSSDENFNKELMAKKREKNKKEKMLATFSRKGVSRKNL